MKAKSSADYQREYRRRLREQGLVKKEVWVRPEHARQLVMIEKKLRQAGPVSAMKGVNTMSNQQQWTTQSLYSALRDDEMCSSESATVDVIDGVEPSLYIVMKEYGDLPVFLTVAGDQIIAESMLWSVDSVANKNEFNEVILSTHKFFPLSTISLDKGADGAYYYQMFGALSSSSIIENVVLEIEMLATNVIQATEAYSEYLSDV